MCYTYALNVGNGQFFVQDLFFTTVLAALMGFTEPRWVTRLLWCCQESLACWQQWEVTFTVHWWCPSFNQGAPHCQWWRLHYILFHQSKWAKWLATIAMYGPDFRKKYSVGDQVHYKLAGWLGRGPHLNKKNNTNITYLWARHDAYLAIERVSFVWVLFAILVMVLCCPFWPSASNTVFWIRFSQSFVDHRQHAEIYMFWSNKPDQRGMRAFQFFRDSLNEGL